MRIHVGKRDYSIVIRDIGQIIEWSAYSFIIPVIISLLFGESGLVIGIYALSGILTFIFGWTLNKVFDNPDKTETKHALLGVSVLWLLYPVFAAIPFVLIQGMSFVDSYFEVISAITTTGLTVMNANLASAPGSLVFWRSIISWIGGMGIVVMAMMGMLSTYNKSFRFLAFPFPLIIAA